MTIRWIGFAVLALISAVACSRKSDEETAAARAAPPAVDAPAIPEAPAAGSTGGRYYSAQDGAQLSRAVKLAALNRLPYDILNPSGSVVASGQTSELSRELPPGKYRIRVDALGQVLEDSLTIAPNQTTTIGLGVEGEQFVLRR